MLKSKFARRFLYLACVCCFVLLSVSSCAKNSGDGADGVLSNKVITNIYSPADFSVPDDYWMTSYVTPYYDAEAETITCFSIQKTSTETAEKTVEETYAWLYTFTLDGEVETAQSVPLPSQTYYVASGAVTEKYLYYVTNRGNMTILNRFDRETGESISTDDGAYFFDKEFYLQCLTVDGDGYLYCTDNKTVYIIDPALELSSSFEFPTYIYTMAKGTDGAVWVTLDVGMESCAARIERAEERLGEYYKFTRDTESANNIRRFLLNAVSDDDTCVFYYYDKINSIWKATIAEDGTLAEELYADLYNSGISSLCGRDEEIAVKRGLYFSAILSDELFLASRYDGWHYACPVLYRDAGDISLEDAKIVTVAYTVSLRERDVERIVEFNGKQSDVFVVLEDYGRYATTDDTMAGEEKLCFDMVNGFIKPDIVITDVGYFSVSDGTVMKTLADKKLYTDLTPYLETDDTVNFDTLFECVRRMFETENGEIWGISTGFSYSSYIGKRELLGEYAEKGSWTLCEMLDFLDSLPAETEGILREYADMGFDRILLRDGYKYFMSGENSFDSELFVRCLERQNKLPQTYAEWKETSVFGEFRFLTDEQSFAALSAEKVALYGFGISGYYLRNDYLKKLLSDEYCIIGYAADDGVGGRVSCDTAYAITSFAKDPDLCFELIKTFFETDIYGDSAKWSEWEISSLKSQFDEAMNTLLDSYVKDEYTVEEKLTNAEIDKLRLLFENAGSVLVDRTPTAIRELAKEEISAYSAGMGNAHDCAEKISSRAKIWLSEHERLGR